MLSQTTEYALRVVVYLAGRRGKPATIAQIAAATQTPEGYLAKVLRSLALAGLVRSQRGSLGGTGLARPAKSISVLDVVQAVDPIRRITHCPLGIKSHAAKLCPLHRRLDEAFALVEKAFARSPISDLVSEEPGEEPFRDARVIARRTKLKVLD